MNNTFLMININCIVFIKLNRKKYELFINAFEMYEMNILHNSIKIRIKQNCLLVDYPFNSIP